MRFSLVVPVYNVEEFLPGCMDSILKNDCSDCEILLVDDGSTDGISPRLCDEYAEQYPNLVRAIHQENKGPGGARNTGLEAARGEYIFFVDSDDTIAPDSLEILSRAIDDSHADIYTFNMASHDGTGPKTPMQISKYEGPVYTLRDHPDILLSIPAMWARIWKRELFVTWNIRFPDRVWMGEDLRTTTRLTAVAKSIQALPDTLYFYLVRPGSIMQSKNVLRNRDMIASLDATVQWFREQGLFETYRNELCYLAVDHLLLATTVRVLKTDPSCPLKAEILDYVQKTFPDYRNNPYVQRMTRLRRLLVRLVSGRHYRLVRLLFQIKDR